MTALHAEAPAVCGIGHIVIDTVMWLPHYPAVDEKTTALRMLQQVGGPVPTALSIVAQWQVSTLFAGIRGEDPAGRLLAELLAERNVPADFTVRADSPTGQAHVWIDETTGLRTVASFRPPQPLTPEELPREVLTNCQLLHLDGWPTETAIAAATIVRQAGGRVTLDAGSVRPGMRELLPLVNVITAPVRFACQFFQTPSPADAAQQLLKLGITAVFLTDGAAGARVWMDGAEQFHAAIPVTAVDTNGAGDAFAAGVIWGTLHDWPPQKTLRLATHAAAEKCRTVGNHPRLAFPDDLLAMDTRIATD